MPWDQADEWSAREQRWATLRDGSEYIRNSTEGHALDLLESGFPDFRAAPIPIVLRIRRR
ncbi:hypothetical protein [Nocardia abscessus]|uniref:hypothetical protein n=1 Tax=Nocardia abscessus TaxID=120957 RepID=UPI0002EFAE42|nr:hypothetical protein [Nocardia abscessus]MCC3332944.1 hypothetical protein [Nocardia abscessus]